MPGRVVERIVDGQRVAARDAEYGFDALGLQYPDDRLPGAYRCHRRCSLEIPALPTPRAVRLSKLEVRYLDDRLLAAYFVQAACKMLGDVFLYVDIEEAGVEALERLQAKALFSVEGCTAVVTGGAAGIGFAYAEVMAANGANVTLIDADGAALDQAVGALAHRGLPATGVAADVTDNAAVHAAIADAVRRTDRLDAVFANAGITAGPGFLAADGARDPAGAIENIPDGLWQKVLDTNLTGVFTTIGACVPHMKAAGGGSIIVTTSIAGLAALRRRRHALHDRQGRGGAPGAAGGAGARPLRHQG